MVIDGKYLVFILAVHTVNALNCLAFGLTNQHVQFGGRCYLRFLLLAVMLEINVGSVKNSIILTVYYLTHSRVDDRLVEQHIQTLICGVALDISIKEFECQLILGSGNKHIENLRSF